MSLCKDDCTATIMTSYSQMPSVTESKTHSSHGPFVFFSHPWLNDFTSTEFRLRVKREKLFIPARDGRVIELPRGPHQTVLRAVFIPEARGFPPRESIFTPYRLVTELRGEKHAGRSQLIHLFSWWEAFRCDRSVLQSKRRRRKSASSSAFFNFPYRQSHSPSLHASVLRPREAPLEEHCAADEASVGNLL